MELSDELRDKLLAAGASVAGFADLSGVDYKSRQGYPNGIVIGVAIEVRVLKGIQSGPTLEYYDEYNRINQLLNSLDEYAAELLRERGFSALAKTGNVVRIDGKTHRSELPHKTVATRAGLGWLGKCALLVTEQFGPALRISTVLTDAPLKVGTPINSSRCGSCTVCGEICPAHAVSGQNWSVEKDRDEFFNAFACRAKAREQCARIGIEESLCGRCVLCCPWTQRYLNAEGV